MAPENISLQFHGLTYAQALALLDAANNSGARKVVTDAKPAKTPKADPAATPATADVTPSKETTGEEMRGFAAAAAKRLGADGPAKVKAFTASKGLKSIVDTPPELRSQFIGELAALS